MIIAETERLIVRTFENDDAPHIVELLNDAAFLEFIGDRGVRSIDDAKAYMQKVTLNAVQLRDGAFIGMCGLIKRDWLDDVDIGFAYLPSYRSQGYALEAAQATLRYANEVRGETRVAAIVDPRNERSEKLLAKLGFRFERMVKSNPEAEEVRLWLYEFV